MSDGTVDNWASGSLGASGALGASWTGQSWSRKTAASIEEKTYSRDEEFGIVMDNSALSPEHDASLIQAARVIYQTYYSVHPNVTDLPLGVAIDRFTYRGKLIFNGKPILLPQECFIPFSTIDAR